MRARGRNSTYYGTVPGWGRKGVRGGMGGGRIQSLSRLCDLFVSRNAFFFHGACVIQL